MYNPATPSPTQQSTTINSSHYYHDTPAGTTSLQSTQSSTLSPSPRPRLKRSHAAANSFTLSSTNTPLSTSSINSYNDRGVLYNDMQGSMDSAAGGHSLAQSSLPSLTAIDEVSPTSENNLQLPTSPSGSQSSLYPATGRPGPDLDSCTHTCTRHQTLLINKQQQQQQSEDDVDPELLAHPYHRTKRQRIAPPSDAFARLTIAPLTSTVTGSNGYQSIQNTAGVPKSVPSVATSSPITVAPVIANTVAPTAATLTAVPSASDSAIDDIDMRPGQTSWEIAPDRIYVASLDDSDDDDGTSRDPNTFSLNPVVAKAVGIPAVPVVPGSSIDYSLNSNQDPSRPSAGGGGGSQVNGDGGGSLILYKPPPHVQIVKREGLELDDARREERDEALRAFRREQEMVERSEMGIDHDDDNDTVRGHQITSESGSGSLGRNRSRSRTLGRSSMSSSSLPVDQDDGEVVMEGDRRQIGSGLGDDDEAMMDLDEG